VNRFASSLAFHVELLRKHDVLEVNAIDLIGVEAIRLFEPSVYDRLKGAKELFVGPLYRVDSKKPELKQQITSTYSEASSAQYAAHVLQALFPNLGFAFDAMTYEPGQHPEWVAELRICTSEFFDRYFQLSIPDTDISQAEATELVRLAGSTTLLDRFRSYAEQQKLLAALDRFEGAVDKVKLEHLPRLITTILDIGEQLPEASPGFFSIDPEWTAQRIIKKLLDREADKKQRASVMRTAIADATGLSIAVRRVGMELKALSEKKTYEMQFDEADTAALKELCITRIREAAKSGTLAKQRNLAHILFRWAEWTTDDEVRAWAGRLVLTDDGLLTLLKHFTQASSSTTGGAAVRVTWFIRLSNLERFVDLPLLIERARSVKPPKDDTEGQRAVNAFQEALDRRAQGKSEDRVWD
jgi:predicted KAP-like P-loop ATPase